jgi:Ca2+-binding RTX toxin-like protein
MAIFTGTSANDSYLATPEGDNARGLRGDDTLIGNSGRDTLNGNADNDQIFADSATQTAGGNDSLYGGQGDDTLVGARFGFSADSLGGNRGSDLLIASTNGGNTLFGGQADDTLYGSVSGSNTMNGDLGSDVLFAGRGGDRMLGADGNDTLVGGRGNDNMFGESGNDDFQFEAAVVGGLTEFTGAEQVVRDQGGWGGSDTVFDFSTGDKISIGVLDRDSTVSVTTNSAGAAVIVVSGSTTLSDGLQTASNTITVVDTTAEELLAPGSQLLSVGGRFITINDTVNGVYTVGDGQPGPNVKGVSLEGTAVADAFDPDPGVATTANGILLQTTVNDDTLNGGSGNDVMDADAGNDILNGENGADTLIGGPGFDTLTGGDGFDTFRLTEFEPGIFDTITDFDFTTDNFIQVSAAAFGGSLIAGQTPTFTGLGVLPTNFEVTSSAGSVEGQNSLGTIGISSFYYDNTGGGLFFDQDGGGTGESYTKIAQIGPNFFSFTAFSIEIVA